jgi:modulator of drug activity B
MMHRCILSNLQRLHNPAFGPGVYFLRGSPLFETVAIPPGGSMKNVLIINAHQPYDSSPGALNAALVELAREHLEGKGRTVRVSRVADGYDIGEEAARHRWADLVIVQGPVNWMGFPWCFKKYQDEVYGALGGGVLFDGDGRSRSDGPRHYGSGGLAQDKRYMLSLTYNAPRAAFDDPGQYLLQGKGVDDMFLPVHLSFRFMAMQPLDTFVCYDVLKNPDIENDFKRYRAHLERLVA